MKMDPLNNLQVGTWDRRRYLFFFKAFIIIQLVPCSTQLQIIQLVFLTISADYAIIFPPPTGH